MVLVDLVFHHGGVWIRDPKLLYSIKNVHKWEGYDPDLLSYIDIVNEYKNSLGFVGVQQLIVSVPSGKYYEIEGDDGIRTLLSFVNGEFDVINLFAVEDNELSVDVENIKVNDAATDCSSHGTDNGSNDGADESDYDSAQMEAFAKERNRTINAKLSNYKDLHKFMTFKGINEARRYMSLYALCHGYNFTLKKSDPLKVRYTCKKECNFVCLISGEKNVAGVSVKTLKGEHKCEPSFENHSVKANTIAYYFKEKVQGNPKYKIKDMRADLKTAFNINASFGKAKRAKRMILEDLEGSFVDDYKKLVGYVNALKESNPGSDIILKVSKVALAEGKRRFLRMYICFDALKKGFRAGLRPFIGLDGTFLKGKAKGQILTVVAQDSMNHFYPIAWAVVDKETKATWLWFLELLGKSLNFNNGEGITLVSDMQKGLIEAVQQALPAALHRFCVKHIKANWRKKGKKTKEMTKVLWWCAWSTYREELDGHLKTLGDLSEEAKDHLLDYPIETWCRTFFDTVCKNQKVENNLVESFNSWILVPRHKAIIGMLEEIRIKVMEMVSNNEEEVLTWATEWSPESIQMYNEFQKIATRCTLHFNGDYGFEVSEGNDKHIVNFSIKKCTCRVWDLTGIPCPHAIKALHYKKLDPLKEIHWWYSKEAYLLTYHHKLQPVPGPKFWKIDPAEAMEPPPLVNMAGRPREKRKRDKDEALKRQTGWVALRKGRVITCSTCGLIGHNARGCGKLDKMNGEGTSKSGQLKGKKDKKPMKRPSKNKQPMKWPSKDKQPMNMKMRLVDEEVVDEGPLIFLDIAIVDDLLLSAPQPSQSIFDPSPSDHDFEYPGLELEEDLPLRPRGVSELKSRLQQRQKQPILTGSRQISFIGDARGLSKPSELYAPKGLSSNGNISLIGRQTEQMRVEKIKARKGNGKAQQ
ncbi:uncharacterized protein LOC132609216 isoform X2 [Lycium barbarum]|nr:uncharacterized protein LOC132609216 isoform X2 [Lycium barbarum]